jgi:hypothetical protein
MDARETGVGSARGTGGEGRRARRRDHIGTKTRRREDAGDARGRDERVDAEKSEREGRLTVKRFDDAR